MQANQNHQVTGLFKDDQTAHRAVEKLIEAGFSAHDVGVLVGDASGVEGSEVEHQTGIATGVTAGGGLGATLGAIGGALVSLGTIPALGLGLAAAGPVAAAVTGAVAGAAGGGVLGTLAGLGFWTKAPDLPGDLRGGAVLLGVSTTHERASVARHALSDAGAKWVEERSRANEAAVRPT